MGHSSAFHCTVKRLWCTVKFRDLNKNRKAEECILQKTSLILYQEVLTTRRKGCDTTRQHTSWLIRGLLLIPVRLVPLSPEGERWRKSLILPTIISGKDRPCLFPFGWRGLLFWNFERAHSRAISVPKPWRGISESESEPLEHEQTVTVATSPSQESFLTSMGYFNLQKRYLVKL